MTFGQRASHKTDGRSAELLNLKQNLASLVEPQTNTAPIHAHVIINLKNHTIINSTTRVKNRAISCVRLSLNYILYTSITSTTLYIYGER